MSRKIKTPQGLTRSQRKRFVNQQKAMARGLAKIRKRINRVAREYALIFSKQKAEHSEILNRLGFCPDCKMFYCFNFAGGISWCHECMYQPSCLKLSEPHPAEPLIKKQCKPCAWNERDRLEIARGWQGGVDKSGRVCFDDGTV